jgi:hypothetical protein
MNTFLISSSDRLPLRFSSMLAKRSLYESSDTCVSPSRGGAWAFARSLDGGVDGEDRGGVDVLGHADGSIGIEESAPVDTATVMSRRSTSENMI